MSPLSWMTIQCQRKRDENFLSCVAGCRSDRRPSPAKNSLAKTQCCRDVAKLLLVRLVFWWYENVSKLPGPVAMDKSVCSRKSLNVWECCQRSFPSSSSRRNGFLISLVVVKFFFAWTIKSHSIPSFFRQIRFEHNKSWTFSHLRHLPILPLLSFIFWWSVRSVRSVRVCVGIFLQLWATIGGS